MTETRLAPREETSASLLPASRAARWSFTPLRGPLVAGGYVVGKALEEG